jgi:hypothetical protein
MINAHRLDAGFAKQEAPTLANLDRVRAARGVLALAIVLLESMGCATPNFSDIVIGPNFVPQNVHRLHWQLPPDVRRLAVLPLTGTQTTVGSDAGLELLYPVLLDEVNKTKKFEVIAVTSEQLRQWTGRVTWNAQENLPPNFFHLLKTELGCDAVLFSRLNLYHAYPPLAVGWNLKLVAVGDAKQLWAADEILDAAEQRVVNGARRHQQAQERLSPGLADSRSILVSPKRFGQYAASTILATLPER